MIIMIITWLVVQPPLWKIWKSIGMMRNPIYGKIKNGNPSPPTSHDSVTHIWSPHHITIKKSWHWIPPVIIRFERWDCPIEIHQIQRHGGTPVTSWKAHSISHSPSLTTYWPSIMETSQLNENPTWSIFITVPVVQWIGPPPQHQGWDESWYQWPCNRNRLIGGTIATYKTYVLGLWFRAIYPDFLWPEIWWKPYRTNFRNLEFPLMVIYSNTIWYLQYNWKIGSIISRIEFLVLVIVIVPTKNLSILP